MRYRFASWPSTTSTTTSPLISGLFHDEPTIEAMNLMGLDFNGVGNHEFDEGLAELHRMQHGGPHQVEGDLDGDPFSGAEFEFLAANVIDDSTGETIFPSYGVRRYQGVSVAFIGLTLQATPTVVSQAAVEGLTFGDEAQVVNALVPRLREQGIEAIVVLLHEGGMSDGGLNDCGSGLGGPVAEVVARLDDAVDIVIAGHTNDEFICRIDGKWVSMADNRGRLFTVIDATLSQATGDLTVVKIENRPNSQSGVTPEPALTALIDRYDALSAPRADVVIGSTTADITRRQNAAGESALGDVIADAHLAATRAADAGGAVVAFTNSGGIRGDILYDRIGPESDGELTYGEAFSVQPFGNSLVTLSLTGARSMACSRPNFATPRMMSAGCCRSREGSATLGTPHVQWVQGSIHRPSPSTASRSTLARRIGSPSTASWPTGATATPCLGQARSVPAARSISPPWSRTFPLTARSLPVHKTGLNASIDCKVAR